MRVLIGFEESGVVRREFRKLGHDAWSCDIKPARDGSKYHYQCDIYDAIDDKEWDLIILHPVCTAMAVSGNGTYGKGMTKNEERIKAVDWTVKLWVYTKTKCDKVAMENPVSVLWKHIRELGDKVVYVHPWQFGHPEQKKTGLALYGVDPLVETDNVYDYMMTLPKKDRERNHYMSPGKNRARDRSETYKGIAEAMAAQWSK